MGLCRLRLVAPEAFPHAEASALAAGAADVLEAARVDATLPQAIADCGLVLGATARHRGISLEELDPRQAARRVLDAAAAGREVALVFGNERSGLENEEVKYCHAAVTIPAAADYSSLNLAQAVQVIAWEVRAAWLGGHAGGIATRTGQPADAAEMEQYFTHLARTLDAIDFHKGRSPERIMQRLRRIYLRAGPDVRELRVLHGILADTRRMAWIARGRPAEEAAEPAPGFPDDD
jgi:tRNA (cytidine32/uridine32-2'-O)-methyltransferase